MDVWRKLSSLFSWEIATTITPILVGTSYGTIDQTSSSDSTQPNEPSVLGGTPNPGTQPSDPGTNDPSDPNGKHHDFEIEKNGVITGLTLNDKQQIKLKIPTSVVGIGPKAFSHFKNLTQVRLGNIKSIDNHMFIGCSSLASITISTDITSIGANTFNRCIAMQKIEFSSEINIAEISDGVFQCCTSLVNVKLLDKITTIGNNAFNGCINLKSIYIPNAVNLIGDRCFCNCKLLEINALPSALFILDASCFENCESIKKHENFWLITNYRRKSICRM